MSKHAVEAAETKIEEFLAELDQTLGPKQATKAEYRDVMLGLIEEAKMRIEALGRGADDDE